MVDLLFAGCLVVVPLVVPGGGSGCVVSGVSSGLWAVGYWIGGGVELGT